MRLAADATTTTASDHVVVFYDTTRYLGDCIAGFTRHGLAQGSDVLLLVTEPHRRAVEALIDGSSAPSAASSRVTVLDARETLDALSVNGVVDARRLRDWLDAWLATAGRTRTPPRIYGEMVALLWGDGQQARALQLEALWNRLAKAYSFELLCGYPLQGFDTDQSAASFPDVCGQHTAVTTESYARLRLDSDRAAPMVRLHGGSPGGRIAAD